MKNKTGNNKNKGQSVSVYAVKGITALPFLTSATDGCEGLSLRPGRLSLGEEVPVINLIRCYMDIAAGCFEEG
jgi:hypothetical protein